MHLDRLFGQVHHVAGLAAMVDHQLHHGAHEVGRHDDLRLQVRLLDPLDARDVGQVLRARDLYHAAVRLVHVVVHGRARRDEVQAKLALQALLHDLHVEKAEESHTEAKAKRDGRLGRPRERRVVHLQLLERVAQVLVLLVVDGEQAREHHGLRLVVAGTRLRARPVLVRDGVAGLHERRVLEARNDVAHLAHAELVEGGLQRSLAADAVAQERVAQGHHLQAVALAHDAVEHADRRDDAAVLVEVRVQDEGLQRRVRVALGG